MGGRTAPAGVAAAMCAAMCVAMCVTLGLAACGSSGSSSRAKRPGSTSVLAMVPASATDVAYTDWGSWKSRLGAGEVTSRSPQARQQALEQKLAGADVATFAAALLPYAQLMPAQVGWSTLDVDRELQFEYGTDNPPVTVLRMRDGFDTGTVVSSLTRLHYTSRRATHGAQTATILTRTALPTDADHQWELPMGTVGVTDDSVVFSGDADLVDIELDILAGRDTTLATQAGGRDLAAAVDRSLSAYVGGTGAACQSLDAFTRKLDTAARSRVRADVGRAGPLQRPRAFGVTVNAAQSGVHAALLFGYDTARSASADLAPRRTLAGGRSPVTEQSYDQLFQVTSATATGTLLTLALDPGGHAARLPQLVARDDLVFDTCPFG